MSLRMRRVAAAPAGDAAAAFSAEDRVGLRLAGRSLDLPMGRDVVAGRDVDCELLIEDRLCSRRHAVFSRSPDGGALVRDLGSTNGTYVNGVRISKNHRLARGDWTTIGNETIELCILPAAPQPVSPTIPAGPSRKAARAADVDANSKTDPGSPLLALASLAATTTAPARPTVRSDAARKPLDALLRRSERGQAVSESDAQMAGMVALNLCQATADPSWLDYLFRLYTALRLPLPAPLLERLSETLTRAHRAQAPALSAYIAALQGATGGTPSEVQRELIARLTELQQRCGGERA